jgi:phage terminase small subunit
MTPLRNTRHETFARGLAEGKSISEAYEAAGYKSSRPHASRLATNGNIKGRVAELQDAAATETEITIRSLIEEAADIQKRATEAGQHSAAIAALIAKAKLAGRWVERSEQKNSNVNYVMSDQPMTDEEWAADRVTEH